MSLGELPQQLTDRHQALWMRADTTATQMPHHITHTTTAARTSGTLSAVSNLHGIRRDEARVHTKKTPATAPGRGKTPVQISRMR